MLSSKELERVDVYKRKKKKKKKEKKQREINANFMVDFFCVQARVLQARFRFYEFLVVFFWCII
jgi:hypothetical protein